MPFNIHPLFLIVILAIVLIVFGPGKLPEVGGAIGRGIKEFKKASADVTAEVARAVSGPESPPPSPGPSPTSSPSASSAPSPAPDPGKIDSPPS